MQEASAILGVDSGGLAFWVAAVRECFEEAGVLLASDRDGQVVSFADARMAERFETYRAAVDRGERRLSTSCRAEDLCITADEIHYFSHWITPVGAPRRYDTRFFVAAAPAEQVPLHDDARRSPICGSRRPTRWPGPSAVSWRCSRRRSRTSKRSAASTASPTCSPPPRRVARCQRCQPRLATDDSVTGVRILLPGDEGYDDASPVPELTPGKVVTLSPLVRRVLAPNPNIMTGPGTNTYLVGRDDLAVIDPGPDDHEEHLDAVAAAGDGRIRWILVTHTHPDHSPGAAGLKARTGAEVLGFDERDGFVPDRSIGDGHVLADGAGTFRLRALHTPGHASNHLCYVLDGEDVLFSGDHIMSGSTVVIAPPDGDMATYLESLAMVGKLDMSAIFPGHGDVIGDGHGKVEEYIAHRLAREAAVLAALRGRRRAAHRQGPGRHDLCRRQGRTAPDRPVLGLGPPAQVGGRWAGAPGDGISTPRRDVDLLNPP